MDCIQTSNKVNNKFGSGTHGFGPGNPATGQVATYLSPDWCNGVQQELLNVIKAGGITPDGSVLNQLLQALQSLYGSGIRYYPAGTSLPTQDRGPIWSADFNSLMTWQVFDDNGANYTGYASQFVGSLLIDTQPTPRAGYVASGSMFLARAGRYAALRAWGQHHGIMVSSDVWEAGNIVISDNPDGTTFRVYDVRGEFPSFWDNGRGVNQDQGFGIWAPDELREHSHSLPTDSNPVGGNRQSLRGSDNGDEALSDTDRTGTTGGGKTQPRNTAFLASIKF